MQIPLNPRGLALWDTLHSCANLLNLTPQQEITLKEATTDALESWGIEWAWRRAGQKHRDFAQVFWDRQDAQGRPKDIFAALAANRSGKTYLIGWLCFALYVREKAVDGDEFWCVCQNLQRSISGQQRELWEALPKWMFDDQKWDEKIGFGGHRKLKLRCRGGGYCVVEFRSADQDINTFEQAKLRGVWCDEAMPEEVYGRLLRRLIDKNGFLAYSDIRSQWWQEERLFGAKPDAGVHCVGFKMWDNAHNLPPGAIQKRMAGMTTDEIKMAIEGEAMQMEGIVYKEFRPRHVIPPFAIPDYWPRWRMIDYGSSAYTACLWVAISEDEKAFVYREHYDAGHSVAHNAGLIIRRSGDEVYRVTLMDPHAVDTPPAVYGMAPTVAKQYELCGIKARGWPYIQTMGEHACVQKVKFRLEKDKLFVFDTCTHLIEEFGRWKHKCDKDGKPLASDAYENEWNHGLDALKGFIATNPCFAPQTIEVVT